MILLYLRPVDGPIALIRSWTEAKEMDKSLFCFDLYISNSALRSGSIQALAWVYFFKKMQSQCVSNRCSVLCHRVISEDANTEEESRLFHVLVRG